VILRRLRYLIALAETGHYGRAARLCHVSQPALSGAIQQLEREFGVPLVLRRHHRFIGITPQGNASSSGRAAWWPTGKPYIRKQKPSAPN